LIVDREFDQLLNKFTETTLAFIDMDNDLENNNQTFDPKLLHFKG
jgi:hypothetical protein